MPDSVRPPERVATVPQIRERSPREEREQAARKKPSARATPTEAPKPVHENEPHALDVEV
ncbi:MAG: hypothetical protein CFK49_03090 [Armatimonadetes bacterium JP3_11]|jgi:hypothetical protein|nr:MAG: hypothetical protein CFK49_03090 [Armatimonadetes bacterium JP3_11]RMH07220.1 MAG: hypothetical protein D6697_09130 [Armatimonadota bacterium]